MKITVITLLCGITSMTLFLGCASSSACKNYFSGGGIATLAIRDSVGRSKKINKGAFSAPEEAFLTKKGDVYLKTFGKLASDKTNMIYVLEIPARARAELVTKFYHKNKHVSGMHTVRLSRDQMHKEDLTLWKTIKQSPGKAIPVSTVTNRKELVKMQKIDQIVFQPPSVFAYSQESLVDEKQARWVWFNAAPASYPKRWLKVFIPLTYLFDIITSPIQIPLIIGINKRV